MNRWTLEKPDGYTFIPGQATHVALDLEGYRDEDRPFTFASLPSAPSLEFVIKTYPQRDGVTDRMDQVEPGQYLLMDDAAGGISYQGEGTFIAGGAGGHPLPGDLPPPLCREQDRPQPPVFRQRNRG